VNVQLLEKPSSSPDTRISSKLLPFQGALNRENLESQNSNIYGNDIGRSFIFGALLERPEEISRGMECCLLARLRIRILNLRPVP